MAEIIDKPIIAEELLADLQAQTLEEKQVIVHCCFPASPYDGNLIRIWPSTFLVDDHSGHISKLVHAENITMYPYWTEVSANKEYWFTLVFTGLPNNCTSFDLREVIPQEGGFWVQHIQRNSTDIYRVRIS